MYSSDLYLQNDINSILPPYEIEPHGIIVAGEEVVQSSVDKKWNEFSRITRNYSVIEEGDSEPDRNGLLSSRMGLNVAVIRKVGSDSTNTGMWFPKKVVVMTDKRRIETMAWAHSSSGVLTRPNSTSMGCHVVDGSQDSLAMGVSANSASFDDLDCSPCTSSQDSDPSLSSVNVPSWYASQDSSLASTSSADSTGSFQLSAISIEPDIGGTSLSRPDQSLNCAGSCDNYKQSTVEPNFGIEIQRFNVPLKVYPGNRSYQMLPLNERVQLTEFPCPEKGCSSILRTRTALRKHALVHAERRFSCNNCGRSFAERTKLNRHMLTHTGERAFKCTHEGCNKAFSLEANLRSHIKTHTGEKSYKCSYCTHAFTHPYNLRIHISRRHNDRGQKEDN
ncbi:hypothetical protein RB195_013782 [Necator americanus]|uniref:C2H2-type domain-containing protein n=1 Tax=Necator americanus TaxID=51031 RepID=A0ABR1DXR7_NECAM